MCSHISMFQYHSRSTVMGISWTISCVGTTVFLSYQSWSEMTQRTPLSYLSWKTCRKDSQVPMIIQVYNFTYLEKVCWEISVYSTMNPYDSYYPEYVNSICTALFEKRSPECQKLILEQWRQIMVLLQTGIQSLDESPVKGNGQCQNHYVL